MSKFQVPPDEDLRIEALKSYEVLDTAPEVCFDDITELAAEILGCPVSFIEFMDADRQWFKSKYGLPEDVTETPRDIAICNTVSTLNNFFNVQHLIKDFTRVAVHVTDDVCVTTAVNSFTKRPCCDPVL